MKITCLTFDCYGTLIDWKRGIEENFVTFSGIKSSPESNIFKSYVALESEEESTYVSYQEILKRTFQRLAKNLGLTTSEQNAEGFSKSISKWPPFVDTSKTLVALGKMGYKRIILSNIDKKLLQDTIENNGLEVDGYITAEDIKSYKPQSLHWTEALKVYNLRREEVIHVAGSVYHDIVPASKLGFKTVWVNRYNDPSPTEVSPTFVVNTLSEILSIL